MHRKWTPLTVAALLVCATPPAAATARTQEVRLWPDGAPGSEDWTIPEETTTRPSGDRTIANVSDPTMAVLLPAPDRAAGAAVVVAPGEGRPERVAETPPTPT